MAYLDEPSSNEERCRQALLLVPYKLCCQPTLFVSHTCASARPHHLLLRFRVRYPLAVMWIIHPPRYGKKHCPYTAEQVVDNKQMRKIESPSRILLRMGLELELALISLAQFVYSWWADLGSGLQTPRKSSKSSNGVDIHA